MLIPGYPLNLKTEFRNKIFVLTRLLNRDPEEVSSSATSLTSTASTLPSRELTYPTNWKGISSSQLPFGWDMLVNISLEGINIIKQHHFVFTLSKHHSLHQKQAGQL